LILDRLPLAGALAGGVFVPIRLASRLRKRMKQCARRSRPTLREVKAGTVRRIVGTAIGRPLTTIRRQARESGGSDAGGGLGLALGGHEGECV